MNLSITISMLHFCSQDRIRTCMVLVTGKLITMLLNGLCHLGHPFIQYPSCLALASTNSATQSLKPYTLETCVGKW